MIIRSAVSFTVPLASSQTGAAHRSWLEALAIFTNLGDPLAEEIATRLADITTDSHDA